MRDALCSTQGGLLTDLAILSLLALSAWLVLRSGRISLGQQGYFALGAYGAGLGTAWAQWPLAPALAAGMLLGGLASAGVALGTRHLSGLHYAVATLALAELVRLGLSSWHFQWMTADGTWIGPAGVDGFRDIRWLLQNQVTPDRFVVLALGVLATALLGWFALARTRFGAALQAVGLDDTLSAASGLPVLRIRVVAAALAGAVAALGGGLYAHRTTFIDPAVFDPMLGVHAVGYAMVGGLASAAGPLLGTALDIGLLEASRWFEGWRMVVFGGAVALFLLWRPRGLLDETTLHAAARALRFSSSSSTHPSDRSQHAHP